MCSLPVAERRRSLSQLHPSLTLSTEPQSSGRPAQVLYEPAKDTVCLLGWAPGIIVLTFRGTASLQNIIADLSVRLPGTLACQRLDPLAVASRQRGQGMSGLHHGLDPAVKLVAAHLPDWHTCARHSRMHLAWLPAAALELACRGSPLLSTLIRLSPAGWSQQQLLGAGVEAHLAAQGHRQQPEAHQVTPAACCLQLSGCCHCTGGCCQAPAMAPACMHAPAQAEPPCRPQSPIISTRRVLQPACVRLAARCTGTQHGCSRVRPRLQDSGAHGLPGLLDRQRPEQARAGAHQLGAGRLPGRGPGPLQGQGVFHTCMSCSSMPGQHFLVSDDAAVHCQSHHSG